MDELDSLDSLNLDSSLDNLDTSLGALSTLDTIIPSEEVFPATEEPTSELAPALKTDNVIGKVIDPARIKAIADKYYLGYDEVADMARLAGGHVGSEVSPEESPLTNSIINLANKSPKYLRPILDVMGFATSNDAVEALKAAPAELAGVFNRTFQMAPWLAAKQLSDESVKPAFDEILAEVEATRGYLDTGAEIATGAILGAPIARAGVGAIKGTAQLASKVPIISTAISKVAPSIAKEAVELGTKDILKRTAKHVATTAAIGGVAGGTFGAATAKTGQEVEAGLEGALIGSVLNVGLSGLLHGVALGGGALINKAVKSAPLVDLAQRAKVATEARAETEAKLFEIFKSGKSDVSEADMDKIFTDLGIKKSQWMKYADKSIEDEAVRIFNAKSDYLEQYVNRSMFKFASEFLPLATGTQLKGVNVLELIDGISTDRKFRAFLSSESNRTIPTQVREKLLGKLEAGADWGLVKYEALKWAEGRIKSNQLDLFNMAQVSKAVKQAVKDTGSQAYIDDLWKVFRTYEEMALQAKKFKGPIAKSSWVSEAVDFLSATHHVATNIERRTGVPLTVAQLNLNRQLEGFAALLPEYEAKFIINSGLERGVKELEKAGHWNENLFFKYMEAADDAVKRAEILNQFPAEARDSIVQLGETQAKVWDDMLTTAKEMFGVNIKPFQRGGYMRHQVISPVKAVGRMLYVAGNVLDGKFGELNPSVKIGTVKDEGFQEFASALKFLSGKTLRTVEDMRVALTEISNLEATSDRVLSIMGSVKSRAQSGGIPDILLEKDPKRLVESWMRDVYRKSMIRVPMMQLHGAVKALRALSKASGDEADVYANQVLNIIRSANGATSTLTVNKWKNRVTAEQILKKYQVATDYRDVDNFIDGMGAVQSMLGTTIISNLLYKPATAVKQLLQPMVFAAEELGGTPYMRELAARASVKSWLDWKSTYSELSKRSLATSGKIPKKYKGERPSPTGKFGEWERKIEQFSNVALFTFGIAERVNRLTTMRMVNYLYRDALKGNAEALKFLREGIESKQVRERVNAHFAKGEHSKAKDLLEDYTLQRTMFTYNEVNKAQFAREIGPMLSMLTRVPTEVIGDVVSKVRSGNASKAIRKYLGPLMYLWEMDLMLGKARERDRNFDSTMHALIGDGGLTTTSGIDSLWGYLEGRAGVPPAVKVIGDLLLAPVNDKALNEFLKRDIFTIVPGADAARYLTDDIVYRGMLKDDSKPARNLFMRADGERRKAPLTMLKGWLAGEPE